MSFDDAFNDGQKCLIPQVEGKSFIDSNGDVIVGEETFSREHHEFLQMRELGMIRPNKRTLEQREQYACMAPNQTIYDLPGHFAVSKRFTPCGRVLV